MTRRFVRIGCLIMLFLLLLFVAIIFILSFFYRPAECYLDSRQSFPSPDHAWVAVVENHKCEWGLGMDVPADWSEVYLVTERPVPLQVIPVLTTTDDPPKLVWSAPDVLQVRVPWPDKFDPYLRNANGVRIDMCYDTAAWFDKEAKWDKYNMETGQYYIDGSLRVKLTPDQ